MKKAPFSTVHVSANAAPDRTGSSYWPLTGRAEGQDMALGRALVLGGGGSTGNAWLIGVVAGLYESGVDVTGADLLVGTSAGSTAAAQITGASPTQTLADTLVTVSRQRTSLGASGAGRAAAHPLDHMGRINAIIAASEGSSDMRQKLGAAALAMAAASDGSWSTRWRTVVAARLPSQHWPHQPALITAVNAATGEPVVFDRHSNVELADAVAASCASTLPYRIGDANYIDGGYRRSSENADLAIGYGRVLVLSPFGGRSLQPRHWGMGLAAQLNELRAAGSAVETIFPDSHAEHMFGANAMDFTLRPPAARAGYGQGKDLATRVADFWD